MFGDVTIFDAAAAIVSDSHFHEPSDHHPQGFCTMKLTVKTDSGETFSINLIGAGREPIAFSAPALENRPCAECGNLMPRDYHPRVRVCSACETDGPPSEGPDVCRPTEVIGGDGIVRSIP